MVVEQVADYLLLGQARKVFCFQFLGIPQISLQALVLPHHIPQDKGEIFIRRYNGLKYIFVPDKKLPTRIAKNQIINTIKGKDTILCLRQDRSKKTTGLSQIKTQITPPK
ncbi:hypothetical protein T9A_03255 [Alcanivorax jadensis T9]|jgi:hypothetical protein|uniref:Uncharacterized protein n=1 Tax=Alcanivorax jadensis T9 TaxID=1177181 RepID=A0ABR4W8U8_9GAMM|nr:hypothetical protein [Alcanivorax jadensis]KGD59717.1 hypothetical protein T9A_03255 [Alcanivorax jadensis T9]|tara:strand:- start:610 stop:939 length:330 start_codon:yes stop_codon:yes gene_type:complete